MEAFDQGFIMLCNNLTEDECLRRSLLGERAKRLQDLDAIKPGDIGFLFNYDKDELIGIFQACSKVQINIEPKAWEGKFAAQFRVKLVGDLQRINDAMYILNKAGVGMGSMVSGLPAPKFPVHGRETIEKVLAHFGESKK